MNGTVDASPIWPAPTKDALLWIGAAPTITSLKSVKPDAIALCAHEIQPDFRSLLIIRCPMDDDGVSVTGFELESAKAAACAIEGLLRARRRVLVTCAMGRNRSAFVAGLALKRLGFSGETAIQRIRELRRPAIADGPDVLSNRAFVKVLRGKT